MPVQHPDYICAIGGSAGMLAPLKEFFDHTPHDDVTYIILRHIPIHWQSELHQILQKHSKLKICEAGNGMELQRDRVYVLPPGMYMSIKQNHLLLTMRTEVINKAIDFFLFSLASEYGPNAIAVLLSGGGRDGTEGVARIRAAGGSIILQHPDTTDHNALPANAYEQAGANAILQPAEIPGYIQQLIEQKKAGFYRTGS